MKALVLSAVRKQRNDIMKKKNVVGVMAGHERKGGQKTGRDAAVVLVEKKLPIEELALDDLVPRRLIENGREVPTDVIEVGKIKALHKSKHRPVLPGISIGHFAITAGTLGVIVDKRNGEKRILSNNHVLANENNAKIGDAILQPGPYDGGGDDDKVAELAEFIPINFSSDNLVDAALAKFTNDDSLPPEDPPLPPPPEEDSDCPVANVFTKVLNKVASVFGRSTRLKAVRPIAIKPQATEGIEFDNTPLNLGVTITREIAEVKVGDTVQKSGRTTGVTVDEVIGIDATTTVQYDAGVARFVDQIICGPMSAGGDSGSVVYDTEGNAVGLLFAGSDKITILNRIQDVFDALDIQKIS